MRVLLVDDEEWNVSGLQAELGATGVDWAYAPTLDDALDLLDEQSFDTIVTDFHMDRLDGKQYECRVIASVSR